ncbi:MAG: DEAD/DEAH box helicase [Myxococcota bacterium]
MTSAFAQSNPVRPTSPHTRNRPTKGHARSERAETRRPSGFDRFDLDPRLARALAEAGYDEPRPIQVETIPACLDGRDVMGLAQTGTGKTAAFALPILQGLLEEPGDGPLVLVLAPTRELARQIENEIRTLARYTEIETVCVFGGVSAASQTKALRRRPEIVVGCPGRVLDLLQQRELDLSWVDTLVLDEADHMFDMGFFRDVRKILAALPKDRQNLLFSATMPKEVRSLADQILNDPHVVELAHTKPSERIDHFLYTVDEGRKRALLDHVLAQEDCRTAIVFTRTKHRAKRLAQQLEKQGRSAVALQGNMSQSQRDRAMEGFRAGRFEILVATDIAARGLDVAGIDYVVNYDVPNTPETYTHRIGRTGRSEATGRACTFVTGEDRAWLRDTERILGAPIPSETLPEGLPTAAAGLGGREPRTGGGRRSGGARGASSRDGSRGGASGGAASTRNRSRRGGRRSGRGSASGRASAGR